MILLPITLYRRDQTRNMHRFYHMDIQLDLFGTWCFIRKWGRISSSCQVCTVPYETEEEAKKALGKQLAVKQKKGYS